MPARLPARQPDPESSVTADASLDWFGSTAGQGLLAAEAGAVTRILAGCPALPWVWIGPPAATLPIGIGGRGVILHREIDGFGGSIRCSLPLPLASEAFGAVLLQHALDGASDTDTDAVLGECARLLAPGGTLWLAALNPWAPYRLRWARTGLCARASGRWQSTLRRAGFSLGAISVQWRGPHWQVAPGSGVEAGIGATDRLRAGLAFTVNKRVRALIPPARLRKLSWQAG